MIRLFESRSEREAREKVAMNMGKKKIRAFVNRCQASSHKYREMAKKALKLGNRDQAEHFVANQIQYDNQSNRWESFLMKLDDIQLRAEAMGAMTGMMDGLSDMCSSISRGISVQGIEKTMIQLQTGMEKVDQVESQVTGMMDGLSLNVGPESVDLGQQDLPAAMKEEISIVCDSLMDELQVEGSISAGSASSHVRPNTSHADDTLQNKLDSQLERLRNLRRRHDGQ